jgi:hypothetical protein
MECYWHTFQYQPFSSAEYIPCSSFAPKVNGLLLLAVIASHLKLWERFHRIVLDIFLKMLAS